MDIISWLTNQTPIFFGGKYIVLSIEKGIQLFAFMLLLSE